MRGLSPRPMAHRTIALTTELMEPCRRGPIHISKRHTEPSVAWLLPLRAEPPWWHDTTSQKEDCDKERKWYQHRPQTAQVNQLNQIALLTTLFLGFFSTVYFCTSRVNFCSLKVYLCNLKVYLYFESILLYLESIPLYFESIPLYFESILLYFASLFVYFERILLYFQSILLYFESIL